MYSTQNSPVTSHDEDFVNSWDVKRFISMEQLCSQCRNPLTRAMRANCCHRMCQNCADRYRGYNFSFQCQVCGTHGKWTTDDEFSHTVVASITELLVERCRTELASQLSPQLSLSFAEIAKRFVDTATLEVSLARLTSELENAQSCFDAGILKTTNASFDYSRIATVKSDAELQALPDRKKVLALTVEGDWLTSVDQLSGFAGLKLLKLKSCGTLETLAGIERLKTLTHLVVQQCNVHAVWGIERCSALRHIEFTECPKFTGLALPMLKTVEAPSSNGNSSSSTAESTGVLRVLNCPQFSTVVTVTPSLQLREFTAANTAFSDLRQLSHCTALEEVDLSNSKVTNITALKGCAPTLKNVNLQNTGVRDISVLKGAAKLEELVLSGSSVADRSFLPDTVNVD